MNHAHRRRMFVFFAIIASVVAGARAQGQTLKSITVSPNPAIAGPGLPAQMHAIGTFSDGSMRDITTAVQWSASSQLTISPTGAFTAPFSAGTTKGTITATLGSVSGTANANTATVVDNEPAVASIAVGQNPVAVAANPVTDNIYVANQNDNTVTVIDGATNATTTIPVCTSPAGLGINTVTNRIYVACASSNVTVIDGATGNTTTIPTSSSEYDTVAVNPLTDQIFVAGNNGIVQIDGATDTAAPFASEFVFGMGINTWTNTLYVSSPSGIDVFDIASGSRVARIPGSFGVLDVAVVNPRLNQVYFGSSEASEFLVLDGATNQASIPLSGGGTIALNLITNQVITANLEIQLYNAATNTHSFLPDSTTVWAVAAIDPITNQVYLASSTSNTLAVLDGRNGYALADTVSTGGNPTAMAVNPVTDLVYVANSGTNNVTVVSGASNTPNIVSRQGSEAPAAAADPFTNMGYFASSPNDDLMATNGATGAIATAVTGQLPIVTLVNPLTNQIYTLNQSGDSISVINGATLSTTNIATGKSPVAGAINPFTNTVYASNTDGSVTVFNGNKNTVTNLSVGALVSNLSVSSMAMNPRTNQLYIADFTNSAVDVLNGYTNAVTSYPAVAGPVSVAVNPVTNLVYIADITGQSVTVLNPASGTTSTIPLPFIPEVVGVNTVTNRIYAAGPGTSGQTAVATIDGVTNQATVATYATPWGSLPGSMVVDSVTNRVYITSNGGQTAGIDGETGAMLPTSQLAGGTLLQSVDLALDPVHGLIYAAGPNYSAIVTEEPTQTSPLSVSIGEQNLTSNPSPTFTLTATDELDPNSPPVEKVYYRFDTLAGPWTAATANSDGTFTVTPSIPLQPGFHVLLAWAANGGENSTSGAVFNAGESPFVSPVARLGFYVSPQSSITVKSPLPSLLAGGTEQLTATELLSNGTQLDVTNLATWTSSSPQTAEVSGSALLTALSAGSADITASYGGLSGAVAITVTAPSYQIRALPILSLDASGNYVVQIALTNLGNTALSDVTLNLAELNSTAGPLPVPIPSLAVGATANVQVVFPASAGAQNSRGLLRSSGSYLGIIPGGTSQDGTFSDNYRIVLP